MKQPSNYLVNEFKKEICKNILLFIPADEIRCRVWHTSFCFGCAIGSKCGHLNGGHCEHPKLLPMLLTTKALLSE